MFVVETTLSRPINQSNRSRVSFLCYHALLCSTSIKTNGNTRMKLKNYEKERRIGEHERDIVNTTSEVLNEHATLKTKLKLF